MERKTIIQNCLISGFSKLKETLEEVKYNTFDIKTYDIVFNKIAVKSFLTFPSDLQSIENEILSGYPNLNRYIYIRSEPPPKIRPKTIGQYNGFKVIIGISYEHIFITGRPKYKDLKNYTYCMDPRLSDIISEGFSNSLVLLNNNNIDLTIRITGRESFYTSFKNCLNIEIFLIDLKNVIEFEPLFETVKIPVISTKEIKEIRELTEDKLLISIEDQYELTSYLRFTNRTNISFKLTVNFFPKKWNCVNILTKKPKFKNDVFNSFEFIVRFLNLKYEKTFKFDHTIIESHLNFYINFTKTPIESKLN
jgi:hypothetical protein